jgi:hypothetical protein
MGNCGGDDEEVDEVDKILQWLTAEDTILLFAVAVAVLPVVLPE